MTTENHPFLTPYLRRHRFHEAVANSKHKVFAVPQGCPPRDVARFAKNLVDGHSPEFIAELDDTPAEICLPVGAVNATTVVEVSTAEGQAWMDDLDLPEAPRIWASTARYYLFDYVAPEKLASATHMEPSLRLLNDGDWIPYPGSLVEGQLVHWEFDPWAFETIPLPDHFWSGCMHTVA